ncbi:MAG: cation-translocating P-type ATPase [Anaerolineales bacterium]|nr:cation-translocating P-type ATPase [Anaerolineales bacterium]
MSGNSWHTLPATDVLKELNVQSAMGLTNDEAAKRLQQYGTNELYEPPPTSFWKRLLAQFNNFVIYILLFAAVVSFIISLRENHVPYESAAILAIVALNTALGVVQEGRAEQALAALKKLAAPEARVLRGGRTESLPASQLVPGDIVVLEAGDSIPADLRLVESVNMSIEEASLTGESVPVEKQADVTVGENAVLGDRHNIAYMSTVVTYGRGKGVVVSTGMQTEIGKIARELQATPEEETPLQKRLNELGRSLSIAALIICGLIFVIGTVQAIQHDEELITAIEESFIIAISLAIAAVPEGLPAVVTINLAIGMREMIKRNALIRRLPAVETLGSATAICSDKTGTLTQNQMTMVRMVTVSQRMDVTGEGYNPVGEFKVDDKVQPLSQYPDFEQLTLAGLLASDAKLEPSDDGAYGYRMIGDPTEGALVVTAGKAGFWRAEMEQKYPRVAEVPFDSTRKRMSTIHQLPEGGKYVAYVKGAPDILINLCSHVLENGQAVPMTGERLRHVHEQNTAMANEALRVLAVAQRHLDVIPSKVDADTVEHDLTLIGLVALRDPARPEVAVAIAKARSAGIKTVMVTGDYRDTAKAIADEIGLLRPGGLVISGVDLEQMGDDELQEKLDQVDAFARVSPAHKVRIVDAFRQRKHVVAMTGDGVNDAPALKRASIGVAMGITGTDVSKESADMILMDDNYATIVSAVEQGRVIYGNIRKFVYFLLSCNLAEIAVIFLATLAGWPTPLTAIQLLWLNLVTDGAPALALGVEKGDPDIMDNPPRDPDEPIINEDMRIGMVVQTIVMTTVTLLAFAIGRETSEALGRTMAFITLSGAQLTRAYSSRSEIFTLFKIGFFTNKYMQYAVLTSAVGLLLAIYVPFMRTVFETELLTLEHWAVLIPLLLLPTVVAEFTKPFLQMRHRNKQVVKSV